MLGLGIDIFFDEFRGSGGDIVVGIFSWAELGRSYRTNRTLLVGRQQGQAKQGSLV